MPRRAKQYIEEMMAPQEAAQAATLESLAEESQAEQWVLKQSSGVSTISSRVQ